MVLHVEDLLLKLIRPIPTIFRPVSAAMTTGQVQLKVLESLRRDDFLWIIENRWEISLKPEINQVGMETHESDVRRN